MSKPAKNKMSKEDFITILSNSTPNEINDFILKNGKPPKLIEPMIFFDKNGKRIKHYLGGN